LPYPVSHILRDYQNKEESGNNGVDTQVIIIFLRELKSEAVSWRQVLRGALDLELQAIPLSLLRAHDKVDTVIVRFRRSNSITGDSRDGT